MNLKGKKILISGANGFLGFEFTKFLLDEKATIIATDIFLERLNRLKKNFSSNNLIIKKLDVTKKISWKKLDAYLNKKKIHVDVLINSAGFTNNTKSKIYNNDFFKLDKTDHDKIMDINLFGSLIGCQIIGKRMISRRNGSIINIASMYGLKSPKHFIYPGTGISAPISYALSKSAVIMLTKYLGTSFAKYNVRVNSISPGGMRQSTHGKKWLSRFSKMCPANRMGYPKELFGAIRYLCSDMSSYSNGANIVVDGGWTNW